MPGFTNMQLLSMRMQLGQIYRETSGKKLDQATDLIVTQLTDHEDQQSYTMERYQRALTASDELAELVESSAKRDRSSNKVDAFAGVRRRPKFSKGRRRAGATLGLDQRGKSRDHGGDEHRGLQR